MMSIMLKKHITRQKNDLPDLLKFADEQRKQGFFNDVTIEIGNEIIPANRMILSCYSNYFKKMFTTPMKERYEDVVKLTQVNKKTTKLLIEYMYTGNIDIDDDNVIDLLSASDYLQLDQVKQFCYEFLESILSIENCFEILSAVEMYRDDSLRKKVFQFISLNLDQISKTENFKNLSKSDLASCLCNLDNVQKKESSVYDAITTWVKMDKEKRESNFPELFQLLQLNRFSDEFLANVVPREKLVRGNLLSSNLVLDEFAHRTSVKLVAEKSKIFGLVRNSNQTLTLYKFDQNFQKTDSNFPSLPVKCIDSCQIFKVNNFVFYAADTTIWGLNLKNKNFKWELICNLNPYLSLTFFAITRNLIESIELVRFGKDGKAGFLSWPLNENKPIRTSSWHNILTSKNLRINYATIFCDGNLYVLGGRSNGTSLKTVERFPGVNKKWQMVAPMQNRREQFVAVSYKHFLFALGDYDLKNDLYLNSVEKFDSIENTWANVKPMINEKRGHTACVVDGKIFVAGGENFNGDVKEVECYDISRDEWTFVESLNIESWKFLSMSG